MNILNDIKNSIEDIYWVAKWKIIEVVEDIKGKNIKPFVGEEFVDEIKPKKKKVKKKSVKKNKKSI
jgi:hypothetical protein